LKRQREDEILVPTKQIVANFFDNNICGQDNDNVKIKAEDRLFTAAASRNQHKLA
jgi:hypothetical protein